MVDLVFSSISPTVLKEGTAKGERVDAAVSTVCSGQTFRVRLQDFM